VDGFNSLGTQTCNFNAAAGTGYDDLGRLTGVDCGSGGWGQTFSYDQYDNLNKAVISGRTGTTWATSYYSNNNHYFPSTTYTYDNSGNLTNDSFNTYTWDAYGKMLVANSTGIIYDAMGRAVEIDSGSSGTEIWYTQLGKTAYMFGRTINYAYWPMPGGGTLLEIGNSGADYYLHKDWLGNARISTSVAGHALVADNSFSPYGETYNVLDSTNLNQQMFTGLTQDVLSGMWDTPNRELSPQGRWLSPDPAGQGWNQYAYATNPNSLVDPTGLGVTGYGGFHQYPVGNPWYTVDIFEWMGIATGSVGADGSCAVCQNTVFNLFTGQPQAFFAGTGFAAAMLQQIPETPDSSDSDVVEEINPETEWERAMEPVEPSLQFSLQWPPADAFSASYPGPLSSYPPGYAESFSWYLEVTLESDATYYRGWGDPAGLTGSGSGTYYSLFNPYDYSPELDELRDQMSLPSTWNSLTNLNAVTVPAGTTVYMGPASPQQGYNGGGFQVFVPNI
jgi:RHS repeat-associated protein